jgi:NOL1/NOP2/fmu family ribosome biogenesis protein
VFEPLENSVVAELWNSRFGVATQAFDGFRFFRKSHSVWVISDSHIPKLSYETLGMRIMNLKDRPWKPTTCALQIFGRSATKNLIQLDEPSAKIFLTGGSQSIESVSEPGYVVVFYRGEVLGCGLYSHGKLISQLPKERRMDAKMQGEDI